MKYKFRLTDLGTDNPIGAGDFEVLRGETIAALVASGLDLELIGIQVVKYDESEKK